MDENAVKIRAAVAAAETKDSVSYVLNAIADRAIMELNNRIINCKRCDICNAGRSLVTNGIAKPDCVMVISEHVTKEQLIGWKREPVFVPYEHTRVAEQLGLLLSERFQDTGLFYSDVVHCYPYRSGFEPRPPKVKEISCCLQFLWQAITIMRPCAIMLTGNIAVNAVLPGQFIADVDHGKWCEVRDIPAMIFQRPDILLTERKDEFIRDLDAFVKTLKDNNVDKNNTVLK